MVFRTSYGSISRPIGNLTISAFALAKGRSNYDGVLTLDTIQSSQENVNAFMSGFFSGGGLPLVFDAPDASPDLEVSAALQGINIIATINSPGYPSFLRNLKVLYNPNTTSNQIFGAIEFFNPLDVEMQITGFNLTLKTVESGMDLGRLSATGSEALLPGIGKVFEYGISDHQLDVEGFKDYFRQDSSTEIEVEGYVQVDIAGEKTKLSVELKRLVSLVETKGSAE